MSFKKRRIYRSDRALAGNAKVMWLSITAGLLLLIVMLTVFRSLGQSDADPITSSAVPTGGMFRVLLLVTSSASPCGVFHILRSQSRRLILSTVQELAGPVHLSETPQERTHQLAQELDALDKQHEQRQAHGADGSDHEAAQDSFASARVPKLPHAGSITSTAPQEAAEKGAGADSAAAQGAAAAGGGHSSEAVAAGSHTSEALGAGGNVGTGAAGRLAEVDPDHAERGDANERKCHVEEHAEFGAPTVVVWGSTNIKVRDAACFFTVPHRELLNRHTAVA